MSPETFQGEYESNIEQQNIQSDKTETYAPLMIYNTSQFSRISTATTSPIKVNSIKPPCIARIIDV